MMQESPSKTWIPLTVAIIGGSCAIIAAIVSGFADKIADRMLPPLTPTVSETTSLPESPQQQNIPASTVVVIGTMPSPKSTFQPIREHYAVDVGDGVFDNATFSDGMAEYSEPWLWDNSHFDIQRIRPEEQPSGCDISRYSTDLVWVSATTGVYITINGENVGTYTAADDPHGYILKMQVGMGDKICAVNFTRVGYSIIMGPDIYYQYDSYCYRSNCKK